MSYKAKLIKKFAPLSMIWWCFWSSIRFRKAIRDDIPLKEEDKVKTLKDIKFLVNRLYSKFTYTKDGVDQLGDAITPPPQNYQYYLNGELKDDCDGFHSLVYHCLHGSGIECYLLTVTAEGAGHCILLFKLNNKWYTIDYTSVSKGYDTAEIAVQSYNEIFPVKYKAKSLVLFNGLVGFNYNTKCFYLSSTDMLK